MVHIINTLNKQLSLLKPTWEKQHNVINVVTAKKFTLGKETHVWKANLNYHPYYYERLSLEEKKRASRFRLPKDQNRYIAAHYILRSILGTYINCEASIIHIDKGKNGKPFLASRHANNYVFFNLTHSEDLFCLAVSKKHEVGMDLEIPNLKLKYLKIAQHFFTSEETDDLTRLPKKDQSKAFCLLWMKKEAILKTLGIGLSGLDEMVKEGWPYVNRPIYVCHFEFENQLLGTVAVETQSSSFRFFSWSEGNS